MNVALSSRHTVHATRETGNGPKCHIFGAPHGTEAYRPTTREVTCKKCLKALADEVVETPAAEVVEITEVQDEVVVTLAPVETPATEVAEVRTLPIEILATIFNVADLPSSVRMDATTRILSGPVKHMVRLYKLGMARLTDDGDLVLM